MDTTDTGTTRRVAREYVEALERRDWPAVAALLDDDVVYEMPQSRERIRGRERYLRFNQEYPGDWHLRVRRVVADGPHAAVWVDARVGSDPLLANVWLELSGAGRIRRITDLWPEASEPLAGREHWWSGTPRTEVPISRERPHDGRSVATTAVSTTRRRP